MKTIEAKATYKAEEIAIVKLDEDLAAISAVSIASDEDAVAWAEDARAVARDIKATEDAFKTVSRPLSDALAALTNLFAPRRAKLKQLDAAIRKELGRWTLHKAEQQRLQLKVAAEAANDGNTQALTTALQNVQAAAPVRTQGVSIKEVWCAEIIAPDMVPLEWRIPDEKRIAKHAKDTPASQQPFAIPGVRFVRGTASRVSK